MLMMEKISLVEGPLINTFPAKVCIKNSCFHCVGGGIVRWCSCQAQTLQNFASSQSPLCTDVATILSHYLAIFCWPVGAGLYCLEHKAVDM